MNSNQICNITISNFDCKGVVYALGGAPISWRTDSAGAWRKEYKLFDHLGSVRTVLRKGLNSNDYEYREQISYNPFGEVRERLYCTDNTTPDARLKYIGKQLDYEMNLADHGKPITNYELRITTSLAILSQFTNIDPMWEKYYGWTP